MLAASPFAARNAEPFLESPPSLLVPDGKGRNGHTSWIALRSALGISILAAGPVSTQL